MLQVHYGQRLGGKHRKKKDTAEIKEDIHLEADWEGDIQPFLIGEIGLREIDTYKVTFVEYRAHLKAYEERLLQGWRLARFVAWRNELVSQIPPHLKKSTAEEFLPLKGDDKIKRARRESMPPINQKLSEGEEIELFRIIGNIRRS